MCEFSANFSTNMQMFTIHTRHLPHYHATGRPMFITFCLRESLPECRVFPAATTSGEAFLLMDRLLDNASTGPLYLRKPETDSMVVDAIRYLATAGRYELHGYVVMGNHVYLLITPLASVSKITQSLKRFTAREANQILCRTGQPFWQEESYDRLVRDDAEFRRTLRYIEMNPVSAGLVGSPEGFRWSSAWAD